MNTESKFLDKKNKSTIFVLPLLENIPKIYLADCVNCYIDAEFALPEDGGTGIIYIAFTKKAIEAKYFTAPNSNRAIINKTRVEALTGHPDLVDIVDVELFKVFSFALHDSYLDDIWLFLNGQYSRISKKAKSRMLNFYTGYKKLKDVLNPTAKAKQEFIDKYGLEDTHTLSDIKELLSKPNWEQETFKLSNFLILEE